MGIKFTLRIIGEQSWDTTDDNIDVEVVLDDGRRFGATFFTLTNIAKLFENNRKTGECASGLYLWATRMLISRDLRLQTLRDVVEDLIDSGEFESAFQALDHRAKKSVD